MDTQNDMLARLLRRKADFSLEQPFYNAKGYFDLDMKHIWEKGWIFAGLTCEIPNAGDFFTLDIGSNPVIVTRDPDGSIHGVFNTCRHRGSKICLTDKGNAPKLVCPYHQWTYNQDGGLIYAGNMGPDFKTSDYKLKKVHLEVCGGYIFVSLARNPAPFEPYRQAVEPYLLPHDIDNCKVAYEQTLVEQANWKLVLENNRECYHCAGSHPELLNTLSEFDNSDDPRIDPKYRELMERKAREWEAQGLPHKPTPVNLQHRAVRLPFINEADSMTIDGTPACGKMLGKLTDRGLGSVRMLHLPNTWNHLQSDHVLAFRVLPLGPQQTLVTTKWLVNKDAVEGVDYDVEKLTKVWKATNEQDRELAENNQLGINSMAYQPGPYSGDIEFGVQNFIDWYCGEMEARIIADQPDLQLVSA